METMTNDRADVAHKKVMPLVKQKKINNYLFNVFYLSIILGYKGMYPWFYETYIQLYYVGNKNRHDMTMQEAFLDFYGGMTEPRKILDFQPSSRKVMKDSDIISYIKEKLMNNQYIFTYFDEVYLGNEKHNCHDVLVYGIDLENETVKLIAMPVMDLQVFEVPFDKFREGFQYGISISEQVAEVFKEYTIALKPTFSQETQYEFHLQKFLENLYEYKESIRSLRYDDAEIYRQQENVFGIEVYDALIRELQAAHSQDRGLDYRLFHTLYEHKGILLEQMQFVYEKYGLSLEAEDLDCLVNLQKNSSLVRMRVMKYNFTMKKSLLQDCIDILTDMKKMEKPLLDKVYLELDTFFRKENFSIEQPKEWKLTRFLDIKKSDEQAAVSCTRVGTTVHLSLEEMKYIERAQEGCFHKSIMPPEMFESLVMNQIIISYKEDELDDEEGEK